MKEICFGPFQKLLEILSSSPNKIQLMTPKSPTQSDFQNQSFSHNIIQNCIDFILT